jgi:hypothetical protein
MNKEKRKEYIITGFAFMILSGLCLIIFNSFDIVLWMAFIAGLIAIICS